MRPDFKVVHRIQMSGFNPIEPKYSHLCRILIIANAHFAGPGMVDNSLYNRMAQNAILCDIFFLDTQGCFLLRYPHKKGLLSTNSINRAYPVS